MKLFICLVIFCFRSWPPIAEGSGQETIPQSPGPPTTSATTTSGPPPSHIDNMILHAPAISSAEVSSQGPSQTVKLPQPPSLPPISEVSENVESEYMPTESTTTKRLVSELVLAPSPPVEFEHVALNLPTILPHDQSDPHSSHGNILVSGPAEKNPSIENSADPVMESEVSSLDVDISNPVDHPPGFHQSKSAPIVTASNETGNKETTNESDSNIFTTDNTSRSSENETYVDDEIYEMEPTTPSPYYYIQALKPVYSDHGRVWMGLTHNSCGRGFSCAGRCGRPSKPKRELAHHTINECRCDQECWALGDCCQDYFDMCAGMLHEETLLSFLRELGPKQMTSEQEVPVPPYLYRQYGGCEAINYIYDGAPSVEDFWIVNSCPENYYDEQFGELVRDQCQWPPQSRLLSFPVSYRLDQSLVFKNIFCALCHGFELVDIIFWPVQVYCTTVDPKLSVINTLEDVEALLSPSSGCSQQSLPLMPSSAMPRQCFDNNKDRSPRLRCSDQFYNTEPYISDPAYENVELLCKSYYSPVDINGMKFANPHCAVCGHIIIEQYPSVSFCSMSSSLFGHLPGVALLASVTFFDGHWILNSSRWTEPEFQYLTHKLEFPSCPGVKVKDSRIALLRMCSTHAPCQNAVSFFLESTDRGHADMRCSLEKYLYQASTGRDINSKQTHGYYPLVVELSFESISESLSVNLQHVGKYFQQMLSTQCNCFIEPKFNTISGTAKALKLSIEVGENYRATLKLLEYFKIGLHVKYEPGDIRVTIANFEQEKDVCGPNPLLKYGNVPLMHYAEKLFVAIPSSSCYVELEEIAFRLSLQDNGASPLTVDEVLVCGVPDLFEFCQMIVFPPQLDDRPSIRVGMDIQLKPKEMVEEPLLQDLAAPSESTALPLSDKKIFNSVCYSISLTGSLALIISNLGVHGVKKSGYLVLSLSKLSLLVLVILHLVAQHCSMASHLIMGMFSHFCWFFQAFLVLMSAFFVDESETEKNKTSSRYAACGYKHFAAILITGIALSVTLVATCAVLEDVQEDGTRVDYSYSPDRVFWMANQKACYISIVGTLSVCLVCAVVFYTIKNVQIVRQKSSKERQALPKPRQTSCWPGSLILNAFAFFLLALLAVCDYADPTRQFWYLFFAMSCCGVGVLDVVVAVVLLWTSRSEKRADTAVSELE